MMGLRRLRLALVVSWWAVGDGFFVARAAPSTRVARCACDEAMYDTYDALAARCVALVEAQAGGGGVWIGIAGGPGAGKSTVAEAVAARAAKKGVASVVLPMDGFHYSKAELRGLDPPDAARYLPRRGAPWTFDAARFCGDLRRAKANERASWPTYSRVLSDPVAGGAAYDGEALVLCEGNYLLLGALADRGDLDPDVRAEAARWRPLLDGACFDETWRAAARRELRFASTLSKRPPRGNRVVDTRWDRPEGRSRVRQSAKTSRGSLRGREGLTRAPPGSSRPRAASPRSATASSTDTSRPGPTPRPRPGAPPRPSRAPRGAPTPTTSPTPTSSTSAAPSRTSSSPPSAKRRTPVPRSPGGDATFCRAWRPPGGGCAPGGGGGCCCRCAPSLRNEARGPRRPCRGKIKKADRPLLCKGSSHRQITELRPRQS